MHKRVLLSVLWLFATVAAWTGGFSTLVVELKGGTSLHYVLYQFPVLTLEDEELVITFHEVTYPDPENPTPEQGMIHPETSSITYQVAQVKDFHFKMHDPNAVEAPLATQKSAIWVKQMDGQTLTIGGTEASDHISLYTTDGRMVQRVASADNGETSISIGALEKGIYIIQVNENVSFKILKQ